MRRACYIAYVLITLVLGCGNRVDPSLKSKGFTVLSDESQMKEAGDDFLNGNLRTINELPKSQKTAALPTLGLT
jgi:hypothetical protein